MISVDRFNKIIEEQIKECRYLLIEKAKEYATEDRLHNFNVGAELTGKTPAAVLGGFMLKHTTSLYDMIMSGEQYTKEQWNEKITDHINYLLILQAVLQQGSQDLYIQEDFNSDYV